MTDWATNLPTGQPMDWQADELTDQHTKWPTDWLTDWLAGWLIDLLIDCMLYWLTHFFQIWSALKQVLNLVISSYTNPLVPKGTGKNNGFPILDIFGYLKNTHKNPKFGKVRQIPIREFPTKFPNWDLSHSPKFSCGGLPLASKIVWRWTE